jgi:hypothetical protein
MAALIAETCEQNKNNLARAVSVWVESEPGSSFLFEHDLFRKPVPTFRDHALAIIAIFVADLAKLAWQRWLGSGGRSEG